MGAANRGRRGRRLSAAATTTRAKALLGLAGCFVPPVTGAGSGSTTSGPDASSAASAGSTGGQGGPATTGSTGSAPSSGAGATAGSTGGGSTTGAPDAGACLDRVAMPFALGLASPSILGIQGSDLPTQTQLSVWVRDANNRPVTGCAVRFAELPGEGLVTLDPPLALLDADGKATTTATTGAIPGTATIEAFLDGVSGMVLSLDILTGMPDGGLR